MEHCGTEQLQTRKRHALAGRVVVCECVCVREREKEALYSNKGKSSQQQHIPHCGLGKHTLVRNTGKGKMLERLRYIPLRFLLPSLPRLNIGFENTNRGKN